MSLQTRVDKLEASCTAGTLADRLGLAVVEIVEGGMISLPGGEVVSADELNARLAGCKGHLLVLGEFGLGEINYK